MGKDKKEEEYSYTYNPDSTSANISRETISSSLARKKFHFEGGVWFCNICNDIGRCDAVHDFKCQGCGATEVE